MRRENGTKFKNLTFDLNLLLSIFREVLILFRSKLLSIVVLSAVQRCASTGTQNLRSASKNGHNHISRGTAA